MTPLRDVDRLLCGSLIEATFVRGWPATADSLLATLPGNGLLFSVRVGSALSAMECDVAFKVQQNADIPLSCPFNAPSTTPSFLPPIPRV